ncbi:MAG TPA: hypothetical protein VIY70_03685 [Acidimicrobiia bacterium]|jgi:hypothetical protein
MSVTTSLEDRNSAGIWLRMLRLGTWCWLLTVLVIGSAGIAAAYRDPTLIRIDELSAIYESVGLSDRVMMTAALVLPLAFALTSAAVIAVRRPDDMAALLLGMCMVGLYFFTSGAYAAIDASWIRNGSASLAVVLIAVFLVVFPTGTFRPRWSVAAPITAAALAVAAPTIAADTRLYLTKWEPHEVPVGAWGGWSLILLVAATAQIRRYRAVSTDTQRDQTRWVMLGAFGILLAPGALLVLNALGRGSPALTGGVALVSSLGSYLLPVTLMIAIFRHHLYDIDAVISRTVTYSLIAIVVTASFVLPVLVLGSLLGESNDLVVAGSTLLAAAVFSPARRRIQRTVEHRFNRAAYDVEQVMERFSAGLRADLSIESVANRLEHEIERTVQPATATVWIRDRE